MTQLECGNSNVRIDEGELVSFKNEGHEFIHQKGNPGWRNADTEMFPIIGPTNEAGFNVQTPKGNAIQDQHGLLRELDYQLASKTDTSASFKKMYKAGAPVKNSKFPEKSTQQWLLWPYSFEFEKCFELKEDQLEITFKISGEQDMPFMLGYHPAFKLHIGNPIITANAKDITLDEVLEVGNRAFEIENCESITLNDKRKITIDTQGFGHFMCWTEVTNMVCIEPISFYPYSVKQTELYKGFQFLGDTDAIFKVNLKVD
ncbi:aldose 1-epimerase [Flagellimonas pacifica]|uniref:Aldose 1-epimerase n=1 Tax=Flagellimonas pacifica TaxID=1247520 RepID=A0A285N0W9_9FLAO|nr:aldose 1-epimerase [Allomuricauda parva]SNZ01656.1 Aldose 1-epimerase [Allomuricauda parva]